MKIIKRIGLICCAVLLGIGAIFLPRTAKSQSYIAKADSVTTDYIFVGSSVLTPVWRNNNNNPYYSDYVNFKFTLSNNSDNSVHVDFSNCFGFIQTNEGTTYYGDTTNFLYMEYISLNSSRPTIVNFVDISSERTDLTLHYDYTSRSTWVGSYNFYIIKSGNFNCNVSMVHLYSTAVNSISYNVISYVDYDNNSLSFYFPFFSQRLVFSDRTYYVNQDLDDNQLYNQGYQEGLSANQQNIYQEGRQDGFNGGYNQGYQEGVSSASNNNFFTLIGAAVDVPITALTSLLNFTFLGVNLLSFVTSILTLALIIFVIKKFMGKG